eukprot:COSAG02_NODE_419_length_22613_cov_22.994492_7_plen_106_part_00
MLSAALLWALWPQSAIKDPWDSNAERDQFEVRWASGCAVATSSLAALLFASRQLEQVPLRALPLTDQPALRAHAGAGQPIRAVPRGMCHALSSCACFRVHALSLP